MKRLLVLLIPITITTVLFASAIIPYNNAKKPSLSLPTAYECALRALGSMTNEFHCLSANITTDFSSEGEWQFTFYSTNSKPKWVSVEFNGKVHIENIMVR